MCLVVGLATGMQAQQASPPKVNQPTQIQVPTVGLVLVRDCSPKLLECLNHFKDVPSLTLLAESTTTNRQPNVDPSSRVMKATTRIIKIKNNE